MHGWDISMQKGEGIDSEATGHTRKKVPELALRMGSVRWFSGPLGLVLKEASIYSMAVHNHRQHPHITHVVHICSTATYLGYSVPDL